jgi:SAM-dependent methyltransferase
MHHLPGKFGVVECKGCELVRLSPRPRAEHLGFYYPDDEYYSYSQLPSLPDLRSVSLKEKVRRSIIARLGYPVPADLAVLRFLSPVLKLFFLNHATFGNAERFPPYVPDGKALDIGCGSGLFLSVLRQFGWSVQGVELSSAAAQFAKEKLGINVFAGELVDARFAPNSFDFVSLNHSLEHLPEPLELLREVRRILKPGGRLYVGVPNVASVSRRISKEYWLHWDVPRHLFGFSPQTLERILIAAGFQEIDMSTIRADFYGCDIVYAKEEASGTRDPEGAVLSFLDRLKAGSLKFLTNAYFLTDRTSGDYISCVARKSE